MDDIWYLAPSEDIRHQRLIRRHELFGKTPEEALKWALGTDEVNARLIAESAQYADLVVRLNSVSAQP
jgi:hypothetical protein